MHTAQYIIAQQLQLCLQSMLASPVVVAPVKMDS